MAKKDKTKVVDEALEVENDQIDADETSEKGKKKKDKKEKKEKNHDGKGGKGKSLFTLILLLLLIASAVGYIIMFNGFGIRDGFLRPYLEKIPVVSEYLPPVENNASASLGEAVVENETLKAENELLKQQLEAANTVAQSSVDEIERLKLIEAQQTEFVAMKEEFDKNLATMSPEDFITYYEAMYPDVAAEAYSELISEKYNQDELDQYIATYQTMDAGAIAPIFEEMIDTDIELVVLIMENLDDQLAGEVLGEMSPANAAQVTRLMSPDTIN